MTMNKKIVIVLGLSILISGCLSANKEKNYNFIKGLNEYQKNDKVSALENYKKAFARRIYGHFIDKLAPAVNRKINRVAVRKMTTRWGSCNSRKGYINLSLNLIEKAPELVEYVVLHELAHLIYPHHQKSFYDFIAKLMPDFKTREQRLNKK